MDDVDGSEPGQAYAPATGPVERFAEPPEELQDEPFEVPEPPATGDPVVDEAVTRVAQAVQQPLDHQVGVYDAVHRALQDRLADVED